MKNLFLEVNGERVFSASAAPMSAASLAKSSLEVSMVETGGYRGAYRSQTRTVGQNSM